MREGKNTDLFPDIIVGKRENMTKFFFRQKSKSDYPNRDKRGFLKAVAVTNRDLSSYEPGYAVTNRDLSSCKTGYAVTSGCEGWSLPDVTGWNMEM